MELENLKGCKGTTRQGDRVKIMGRLMGGPAGSHERVMAVLIDSATDDDIDSASIFSPRLQDIVLDEN